MTKYHDASLKFTNANEEAEPELISLQLSTKERLQYDSSCFTESRYGENLFVPSSHFSFSSHLFPQVSACMRPAKYWMQPT